MAVDKNKTERVFEMFNLLMQHPQGITAAEIAKKLGVNIRTVYRDRMDVERMASLWNEKGKWIMDGTGLLPPVHFSLNEAMSVFMAARLMLGYSNVYNPAIASAFGKLSAVAPALLREQIRQTMEWMANQRKDEKFCGIMQALSEAWMNRKTVGISYLTLGQKQPRERLIDPYFIQPASLQHGKYVIAYCHLSRELRTFKIERIKSIRLTDDSYEIPGSFDANAYLGAAFGINVSGRPVKVKLKFSPVIAEIARETRWHHSQETEMQPDGSALVTFKVPLTTELESFILGWGENVEVVEPEKLRNAIFKAVKSILKSYYTK